MADSLNEDAHARIDEMCKKISVAHSLDEDIQEELRGHMEGKALGYLNGQEPITQDDAILLVREHFGDPATVKSMLQDVHIVETQVSLARRLMAIVALNLLIANVSGFFMLVAGSVMAWFQFQGSDASTARMVYSIAMLFMIVMVLFANWKVLVRWETQIRSGERPWFHRWRVINILGLFAGLVSIQLLTPNLLESYNAVNQIRVSDSLTFIGVGLSITIVIANLVIWLWWCDRPPRLVNTTTKALLVWMILSVIPWHDLHPIQFEIVSYDPLISNADAPYQLTVWKENRDGITGEWNLQLGVPDFFDFSRRLDSLFYSLVFLTFIGATGKFLYTRLVRRREPPDDKSPTATA